MDNFCAESVEELRGKIVALYRKATSVALSSQGAQFGNIVDGLRELIAPMKCDECGGKLYDVGEEVVGSFECIKCGYKIVI